MKIGAVIRMLERQEDRPPDPRDRSARGSRALALRGTLAEEAAAAVGARPRSPLRESEVVASTGPVKWSPKADAAAEGQAAQAGAGRGKPAAEARPVEAGKDLA